MAILKEPHLVVVRRFDQKYKPGFFKLQTPMIFLWEQKKAIITVEAGTYTNFSSIPSVLRTIYATNGDHRLPAIIHDFLYERLGYVLADHTIDEKGDLLKHESPRVVHYTREEADTIFYYLMLQEGVPTWQARTMYRAVRLFGFLFARGWKL